MDGNGWSSLIVVRNNSTEAATVYVSLLTANGSFNGGGFVDVAGSETMNFSGGSGSASAIVDANQDVSVVVANQRSPGPYTYGAYTGISADQTSNSFYVPMLLHQVATASGTADSRVAVQKTGPSSTTVTMRFYNSAGNLSYTRTLTLDAGASDHYGLSDLPTGWYGSATVSASGDGAIGVDFDATFWSGVTLQNFNAFPAPSPTTLWFIPQFLSRRSTMTGNVSTPINVQNVSGETIPAGGVFLYCLAAPDSGFNDLTVINPQPLSNNTSYSFNPVVDTVNFPSEWYGSCQLGTIRNVVVLAQIRYPGSLNPPTYYYLASGYDAIQAWGNNRQVFFPVVQKRLADGSATSIIVQNLSTTSTAWVTFYYKAECIGFSDVTVGPYPIPAGSSINHNHRMPGSGSGSGQHNLPDRWCGSLQVISSDQPIEGFGQLTNINNTNGDTIMAHDAIARP